ncbi:feruloyl esterase, putative [Cordyceps militaris CM01]|uniref:Carboxylic ester hydrolase n=1 Tax=Cordyceps militaris (strain CM01) TaxID=983644 RepID=G3JNZ0_CORMM|nr:feruloyl esterase, putative [Cordyceps militaris CM01]EGX89600.1 feruloyl esterase, putative [Cordyceps militaris CM01]
MAVSAALTPAAHAIGNIFTLDPSNPCQSSAVELFAPHMTILDISAEQVNDHPVPQELAFGVFVPVPPAPARISFCNVTITYTHPGWDDAVQVFLGLPLSGWNRKFVAIGGAGFATNPPLEVLPIMAALGYAAAATDGGHYGQDISWALKDNGTTVNYPLLVDMGSATLRDLALLGRGFAEAYYAEAAERAYWVGCSQGGRQGMMVAQRYSELFDGILANAPAMNWNDLIVGKQWPFVAMHETRTVLAPCVLDAFTKASIAVCDRLDGLEDGVIGLPGTCRFDPYSLVGEQASCDGGGRITLTDKHAFIVQQILDGPTDADGRPLFVGSAVGTNLAAVAPTSCSQNSSTACVAHGVVFANEWIPKFVAKDYGLNPLTITYERYRQFFAQAGAEYDWAIGTNDADLRHLRRTDTKLLTFHGFADELIPPMNTVRYYQDALALDANVTDYYRLFLAPGVMHCAGGLGPNPTAMLRVLEDWVENGKAPVRLDAVATAANGTTSQRSVCMYPESSRYTGGDPTVASSFTCS